MEKFDQKRKNPPPHEAILLSQAITEKKQIQITFIDGDIVVEQVKWHTPEHIGMKDGKVINKQAIKFWQMVEDS